MLQDGEVNPTTGPPQDCMILLDSLSQRTKNQMVHLDVVTTSASVSRRSSIRAVSPYRGARRAELKVKINAFALKGIDEEVAPALAGNYLLVGRP